MKPSDPQSPVPSASQAETEETPENTAPDPAAKGHIQME
jgi:hypothetical protein